MLEHLCAHEVSMQQPRMLSPQHAPLCPSPCRSWGVVAYSLVPQLCGLAEALGQGPTTKQSEALCHLLRCLRSLAEMGLADEAVRAGGSRLLSVTAAAFLVSGRAGECQVGIHRIACMQQRKTTRVMWCAHTQPQTSSTSVGAPGCGAPPARRDLVHARVRFGFMPE